MGIFKNCALVYSKAYSGMPTKGRENIINLIIDTTLVKIASGVFMPYTDQYYLEECLRFCDNIDAIQAIAREVVITVAKIKPDKRTTSSILALSTGHIPPDRVILDMLHQHKRTIASVAQLANEYACPVNIPPIEWLRILLTAPKAECIVQLSHDAAKPIRKRGKSKLVYNKETKTIDKKPVTE